jgi:hypothetical protein
VEEEEAVGVVVEVVAGEEAVTIIETLLGMIGSINSFM